LLKRRILFLSFRMMAGRRSRVHGAEQRVDSAMKCLKFLTELFRQKSYRQRGLPRWLIGDDEALVGGVEERECVGGK
jgi:hypothetical protein